MLYDTVASEFNGLEWISNMVCFGSERAIKYTQNNLLLASKWRPKRICFIVSTQQASRFCVCVCSPASFHHPQGDDSSVDQHGFVLSPACQNKLALCLLLPETWLNQQINQFSL